MTPADRVILDEDLAELYGVSTKRLNEQVTRNSRRFPVDFAFKLTRQEFDDLRSQSATSRWGGRRHLPRAFTEHGAVMAASVLNSQTAIEMSVAVVRAFVRMRGLLTTQAEFLRKLGEIERAVARNDSELAAVFDALRQLLDGPGSPEKGRIGFG